MLIIREGTDKDIKEQRLKDKRINAGKGVEMAPYSFFA